MKLIYALGANFVLDTTPTEITIDSSNEQQSSLKYNIITKFPEFRKADIYLSDNIIIKSKNYNFLNHTSYTNDLLKEDNEQDQSILPSTSKDKEANEEGEIEVKEEDNNKPRTNLNRYFLINNSVKCHNCNEIGHISKHCPNEKLLICNRCNKEGHTSYNCPAIKCFRCNKIGHKAGDCSELTNIKCDYCGAVGHKAKDCLSTESTLTILNKKRKLCFPSDSNQVLMVPNYDSDKVELSESEEEGDIQTKANKIKYAKINPDQSFLCPKCASIHALKKKCVVKEDKTWDSKRAHISNTNKNRDNSNRSYNPSGYNNYNNNYNQSNRSNANGYYNNQNTKYQPSPSYNNYRERSNDYGGYKNQSNDYYSLNKQVFSNHGLIQNMNQEPVSKMNRLLNNNNRNYQDYASNKRKWN